MFLSVRRGLMTADRNAFIHEHGRTVTGLDRQPDLCAHAKAKQKYPSLAAKSGITLLS